MSKYGFVALLDLPQTTVQYKDHLLQNIPVFDFVGGKGLTDIYKTKPSLFFPFCFSTGPMLLLK